LGAGFGQQTGRIQIGDLAVACHHALATGTRYIRGPIATLTLAGTIAGCSTSLPSATSQMQPAGAPVSDAKCPSEKGVSVKPCAVKLTAGKPARTVTTKGHKGGTFTVSDTGCTTRLIATIKGSANTYKVTAGAHGKGQCVATFIDYNSANKRLGAAKLIIVNDVDKAHK
jgi:hypothetical protein